MDSRRYTIQKRRSRRKKRKKPFFFSICVFVLALIGLFILRPEKQFIQQSLYSPLVENVDVLANHQPKSELALLLEEELTTKQGTYGVVIKHLKTGEEVLINERQQFETASLYKLWTMGTAYDQIQKGNLTKEEELKSEITTLNEKFNIATEEAELTEGEIEMTVEKAIEQMIIISHNYAALLLSDRIRISNMSTFLKTYGLIDSQTGSPPQTTPYDMMLFFEQLYKGKVVSQVASKEMIALLKRQQINDRIPKYLPEDITVAHKTGELGEYKHDAGIVFTPAGDYIIVMLSQTEDQQTAAETMAELSKKVYDYFEKKD